MKREIIIQSRKRNSWDRKCLLGSRGECEVFLESGKNLNIAVKNGQGPDGQRKGGGAH